MFGLVHSVSRTECIRIPGIRWLLATLNYQITLSRRSLLSTLRRMSSTRGLPQWPEYLAGK